MDDLHEDSAAWSDKAGVPARPEKGTGWAAEYRRLAAVDAAYLKTVEDAPLVGTLPVELERERMRCGQDHRRADPRLSQSLVQTKSCVVRILRPAGAEGKLPWVVYFHGGGWVLGEFATHCRLVEEIAIRSCCAVAFVDYPRAPENPFPGPVEACYGAVRDLLGAASNHGLDETRFALAGDSSGGNLAAAVQLKIADSGHQRPASVVLLYPPLDASQRTGSYQKLATNPILSRKTMDWFWDQYVPLPENRLNPLASPIFAATKTLAQFPPTLCVACEYDVLRDECEEFAARLTSAGVHVTAVRWLGALHGFLATDALAKSSSADECLNLVVSFLRRNFETPKS